MLLTSSGDREAAGEVAAWGPVVSAGLTAAAVRAATIPGARFARGTLRGRPALVVCTEVVWSDGAGVGRSTGAGGGCPPPRSWGARRDGGGGEGGGEGGGAEGGTEAPGVLVGGLVPAALQAVPQARQPLADGFRRATDVAGARPG